jgi:hypothetical protein
MIIDSTPIFDHAPHRDKLRSDLGAVTSDVRGLPTVDVILALLQRAEELTALANEIGEDLTRIRAFFGSDA